VPKKREGAFVFENEGFVFENEDLIVFTSFSIVLDNLDIKKYTDWSG
jgi:hypothetical protein